MKPTFDSRQRRSVDEAWAWYEFQAEVLEWARAQVVAALRSEAVSPDSRFYAKTEQDIEEFFVLQRHELDLLSMLNLMACAEAALRTDFLARVKRRAKDSVSKVFRGIARQKKGQIRLEEDILDVWARDKPAMKKTVAQFKAFLPLRHWLAHGKWYVPVLPRSSYSPADVYTASEELLRSIKTAAAASRLDGWRN